MGPSELRTVVANERLSAWLRVEPDNTVTVFTGKVELGQGALTALHQIAAQELCLPMTQVRMISGDTDASPDEGYTAGSRSVQVGGASIRQACADALARLRCAAAGLLGPEPEPTSDGAFRVPGHEASLRYCELAGQIDWSLPVRTSSAPRSGQAHRWVGVSVPRVDLPAKLRGAAFIHDLVFEGMLHGRVLRPPARFASLLSLDEDALRAQPGVVAVVRDGSFLGVLAQREEQAVAAIARAAEFCEWKTAPAKQGTADPFSYSEPILLRSQHAGGAPDVQRFQRELSAEYSRPFIAHASIGPSCALARFDGCGRLTVWTHSQGVFQLRADLARALRMRPDQITVKHAQGSGCYGHNGADDAALDAALLARAAPGQVVRLQWSRADELGWSPVGSSMRTRIAARFDARGSVIDWALEVDSGTHMDRPGASNDGINLLAAAHLADPAPAGTPLDTTLEHGGGGDRNARAIYDFASQTVRYRFFPDMPLRTSSLRALGAFCNVFAIESFMDELAQSLGEDAIALRLRHLSDPRARAVVNAAQAMLPAAGAPRPGHAIGFGFGRYKNIAAYCAVFAEVSVEEEVRLTRVWCAVDAGLVVNPDGLINQIEGGIVQSASWTLKEEVTWEDGRITSTDWERYPILRFSEVPEIAVHLIDAAEHPSLGVGEAAQGPAAAAIGNAVTRALGLRPRHLPLTRAALIDLIERA